MSTKHSIEGIDNMNTTNLDDEKEELKIISKDKKIQNGLKNDK